ncbi:PD-(D/E)XK nuclease family protein [Streptomyces carpaticus]|uniref:PD-(D/E)XK nuclease family protein n=1 Tax=Streptomyces carpaticus TaxID=285558 RepID=UPI002202BA92|nr:PD-(D/E)XK nuclease family protein [Streptomyces carpaticus]
MPSRQPPPGTRGDLTLIRTGLPLTREDSRDCPVALSVKARPWLGPAVPSENARPVLESFTLKPLMAALDRIEHEGRPVHDVLELLRSTRGTFGVGRTPAHPGLIEWTAHALVRYLSALEAAAEARRSAGEPASLPVRGEWVVRNVLRAPDSRGATRYERTAWGRRYASPDGAVRELRLLSFGSAKENRPPAEVAAAAFTIAVGELSTAEFDRENWRTMPYSPLPPHRLRPHESGRPHRVRVYVTGCTDGSSILLTESTVAEAEAKYARLTAPVLRRVIDGTERTPGSGCVDCAALTACTALPRAPGLLGIPAPRKPRRRRSVSASDLRAFGDCPAKYHLTRQLNLPSGGPENEAIRRGRAVDAVLNERHALRPPNGCRTLPPPEPEGAWADLADTTAATAAAMLEQHTVLCPLDGLPAHEEVSVQRQLTAYDPALDVVVIATPDLLYTEDGGWVWRETKTASSARYEHRSPLRGYPQLALAVLLMAAGVPGGDPRRGKVELEILYEDDCAFHEIDPGLPEVVEEARDVIAGYARPWSQETAYRATPGRACSGCEALPWCGPGREHLATAEATTRHEAHAR